MRGKRAAIAGRAKLRGVFASRGLRRGWKKGAASIRFRREWAFRGAVRALWPRHRRAEFRREFPQLFIVGAERLGLDHLGERVLEAALRLQAARERHDRFHTAQA